MSEAPIWHLCASQRTNVIRVCGISIVENRQEST